MAKLKRLLLVLILLIVAGVFLLQAAQFGMFVMSPAKPGSTDKVVIEIRRGEGFSEVAKLLVGQGVVSDARYFAWLGRQVPWTSVLLESCSSPWWRGRIPSLIRRRNWPR